MLGYGSTYPTPDPPGLPHNGQQLPRLLASSFSGTVQPMLPCGSGVVALLRCGMAELTCRGCLERDERVAVL
jgi:hypothetical protein